MSPKTPTYPFEDLLVKNKIDAVSLSEKTQKRIARFNGETDEDEKKILDESICGDIWDYIDVQEEKKKRDDAIKKQKIDLSDVATAQPKKKAGKGRFFDRMIGRGE